MNDDVRVERLIQAFNLGMISRRTFLKALALVASSGASVLTPFQRVLGRGDACEFVGVLLALQPNTRPDFKAHVVRPNDLLLAEFDFYGAALNGDRIEWLPNAADAWMVVRLPPQHIVEEVALEDAIGQLRRQLDESGNLDNLWDSARRRLPIMRAMLARSSRLAFIVPEEGLDFTVPALLDWTTSTLVESVSAVRDTPDEDPISATVLPPSVVQTAIELPTFVVLAPDPGTDIVRMLWQARATQTVFNDRHLLWHARRVQASARGIVAQGAPTRFFFADTPFSNQPPPRLPTATALTPDNIQSVIATLNGSGNRYLQTDNVLLSALGGWLSLRDVDVGVTGEKWIHKTTMGRDQFVRIVREGFLFPFGHRAALVNISERKFIFQDQGGADLSAQVSSDAFLVKRQFIVVREPLRNYVALSGAFTHQGRELPFRSIRIVTEVTPLLAPGTVPDPLDDIFWPQTTLIGGQIQPIGFDIVGVDKDDEAASFTMPLLFVPDVSANNPDLQRLLAERAMTTYAAEGSAVPLAGRTLAYTELDRAQSFTKSAIVTDSLRFGAQVANSQGGFLPQMQQADVSLPELGRVSGRRDEALRTIQFAPIYLTAGLPTANTGSNSQQVFALFIGSMLNLQMPGERTGLATPSLSYDGLSRVTGPVPFARLASGIVDKDDDVTFARMQPDGKVLGGALFGGLLLGDIVETLQSAFSSFSPGAYTETNARLQQAGTGNPKALADFLLGDDGIALDVPGLGVDDVEDGLGARTTFVLKPKVSPKPPILVQLGSRKIKLVVIVTIVTNRDDGPAKTLVDGKMKDFGIVIPYFIRLEFSTFAFTYSDDAGFNAKPEFSDIVFLGALEFINKLRDLLKKFGFGFKIEVGSKGLKISVFYNVPDITLGALTIKSLKPALGVKIPFGEEKVSFSFGISDRKDPFTIAVTVFGGAGFFAMELDLDGKIKLLEVALEFGGTFALNLGVAKGAAYLMAGIYFGMKDSGSEKLLKFEAYVRAGGKLDILGFIVVSIEFYVGLGYEKRTSGATKAAVFFGVARVTVEISIFFFSFSVGVEYRYEQVSEGADPTFGDVLTPVTWSLYCDSFALDEGI